MNIERALTVEGWMYEPELKYLAHAASTRKRIAEIGSWKGRSATAMALNTEGLVFCVDTWSGHLEASEHFSVDCFKDFLKNTKDIPNILPIPLESTHAAAIFKRYGFQFDMVFIDGLHHFEGVVDDIKAWRELLAPDAIFCGHDYGHRDWLGVEQAVREVVPKFRIVEGTSIWTTEGVE